MKSYNHLYEVCLSKSNRREAIKMAKRSRRIRKIIRRRHLSDDALLDLSYEWLIHYENIDHSPIRIRDGIGQKPRTIMVPTLEELVVQHCIVNTLKSTLSCGMYEHTYASIIGRGAHKGKKTVEKWIRHDPKNTRYVLKMDIHHFFDSVPHDILKQKLMRQIHDELMLDLLFRVIDATDEGIPLGFYTSQWFSNWYLQELDHYIKEELGAAYYIRYQDDMVIFARNKKHLHRMRNQISQYLEVNLGLTLKGNWQVFLFDWNEKGRDLDFMGFRFYRNRTTLRKSILYKATRKAAKIAKKARASIYDVRQMLSYLGWIKSTATYDIYRLWIKPYVNFQQMKRYVSRCDKNSPRRVYLKLIRLYI